MRRDPERLGDIPWAAIIGMRNILVHDYFGFDLAEVWKVVESDLPLLKQDLEKVLTQENLAS